MLAVFETMPALLPPSSSSERPKRRATSTPTVRPISVLPVALTMFERGSATSLAPISRPPLITAARPAGASPNSRSASSRIWWVASAVSGVFSEGFQITALPHTRASAAFQDHTAAGKLKAEITVHTPSGCQVSAIRWPGRSEAIVKP